jgi:hypothetical protein
MSVVRIGTADECLLLALEPAVGALQRLIATFRLDGLSASIVVANHPDSGFRNLVEFFQRLADDWRGWPDIRSWKSEERNLQIDARHVGHVQLTITARRYTASWRASGELRIQAGEQLAQIARDVAELAIG